MALTTNISSTSKGKQDSLATNYSTIFLSLGQEETGEVQLPSAAQCATHLELLDTFVILKARVMRWGESRSSNAESSWQTFVKLAVVRFTTWIRSVGPPRYGIRFLHLVCKDVLVERKLTALTSADILMVWHSFMLNPSFYVKFCKLVLHHRSGLDGIPWVRVVCI
jgi:hypothetical protein